MTVSARDDDTYVLPTLERFRSKLLDLTSSNKLLNLKLSNQKASQFLRFVDCDLQSVLNGLIAGQEYGINAPPEPSNGLPPPLDDAEGDLEFDEQEVFSSQQPLANSQNDNDSSAEANQTKASERALDATLEEPNQESGDSQNLMSLARWAHDTGIDPSFSLAASGEGRTHQGPLRVLMPAMRMERVTESIRREAKSSIDETGNNILYLSFGCLEWLDKKGNSFYAPLILLPVELRKAADTSGSKGFWLKASDDIAVANAALRERLKRDYGIELPMPGVNNQEMGLNDYFVAVGESIPGDKSWKLHTFLTLALLNFNGLDLYTDLVPELIRDSQLVRQLLAAETSSHTPITEVDSVSEDVQVDRPEIAERVQVLIAQADASQFAAVADVMAGRSMVIEGPPGTGKSQTITNIIANALYAGKRVLFVAEKKVALDVVYNRLSDAGLKPYCLRLESDRAHKKDVYNELAERLALSKPSPPSREGPLAMFNEIRDGLNRFTELLNAPHEPEQQSRHSLLWQELQLRQELLDAGLALDALAVGLPMVAALDRAGQEENLQVIEQLASLLNGLDQAQMQQLFAGITALPVDGFALDALLDQARRWQRDLEQLAAVVEPLQPGEDRSPADLRQAAVQCTAMAERLPEPLQPEAEALLPALSSAPIAETAKTLLGALRDEKDAAEALLEHFERLTDPLPDADWIENLCTDLRQWQFDRQRIPANSHERAALQEKLRQVVQQIERLELLLKAREGPIPLSDWSTDQLERVQPLLTTLCALPDWILAQRLKPLWTSDPKHVLSLVSEHQQLEELRRALKLDRTDVEALHDQALGPALAALQRCLQNGLALLVEQPEEAENRKQQIEALAAKVSTLMLELPALLGAIDLSGVTVAQLQELPAQIREALALGPAVLAQGSSPLWDASLTDIRVTIDEERELLTKETQLRTERLVVPEGCSAEELRQAAEELDSRALFSRVSGYLDGRRRRAKDLCRRANAGGASRCENLRALARVVELRQRYPQGWQRQRYGVELRSEDLLPISQRLQRWKATIQSNDASSIWLEWIRQASEASLPEVLRRFEDDLLGNLEALAQCPFWNGAVANRTLAAIAIELNQRESEQADLSAAEPAIRLARTAGIHAGEAMAVWLKQMVAYLKSAGSFPTTAWNELLRCGLDPVQIEAVITAAQDIRQGLDAAAIDGLDAVMLETSPEALRLSLTTLEDQLRPLLNELFSSTDLLSPQVRQEPLGPLLASLADAARRYQPLVERWQESGLRADASLDSLAMAHLDLTRAHRHQETVRNLRTSFREQAGPEVGSAAPELLQQVLSWISELRARTLPQDWQQPCLQPGSGTFIDQRRQQGQVIAEALSAEPRSAEAFCTAAGLDVSVTRWAEGRSVEDVPESTLRQWLAKISEQKELLQVWTRQRQLLKRLTGDDVRGLIQQVLSANRATDHWSAIYRWNVARNRLKQLDEQNPALQQLHGGDQVARRERFHQLEDELRSLDRQQVICAIHRDPTDLPSGNSQGKKSDFTELALIQNEALKQTRHRPLRHLFHSAGEALRGLKPCWMMPPGTVASLLPREAVEQFDLVIIDEASQMPPERALGLISRARQCVVVGDPKQLPPTSFFQLRSSEEDDDGDSDVDTETVNEESILDLCTKTFHPVRRLKWHYRSRHGSLIAFSNKHFYNSELVLFPSCDRDFAIHRHLVADSRYKSGVNPPEVQRVCAVVIEQLRTHPERTLGVVAMNEVQASAIVVQLERLAEHHQELRQRLDEQDSGNELFVKALEKVQGDERDTIVISTTYGPSEPGGVVSLNLGPIKDAGGHRRLNVLFTRARHAIELVTSIQSHQIQPRPTSSEGIRALQAYLRFVEARSLDSDGSFEREPETPFEQVVCEALRRHGYSVDCRVGVANYFIDLAVRHPDYSEIYLLAIECDGPTYHAARAARDRDKYRQAVLEGLGWSVFRIWSTDWSANPELESRKLLDAIQQRLAESASQAHIALKAEPKPESAIEAGPAAAVDLTIKAYQVSDDASDGVEDTWIDKISEAPEETACETETDREQPSTEQTEEEISSEIGTEIEIEDLTDDAEPAESWDDIPLDETIWDASDYPDYPWIAELDRRVHLGYEERLALISQIAKSEKSIDDWIDELLHHQEDLNDELSDKTPWSSDISLETDRPVHTISPQTPDLPTEENNGDSSKQQVAAAEIIDLGASDQVIPELLLDDWQGSSSDHDLVNLAMRFNSTAKKNGDANTQHLIAGLLTFHIRENTAEAKVYKEHLAMNNESLYKDSDCIATAILEETGHYKNDKHFARYRFDAKQPFRFSKKKNNTVRLACLRSRANLELIEVNATEGVITLAVNSRDINRLAEQTNLIHVPQDFSSGVREYLAEQANQWLDDLTKLPATIQYLFSQNESEQIRSIVQQANRDRDRRVQLLNDYLFDAEGISLVLQGPPGSGKTTCAADLIATLVASGFNVGVCANSHLAIDTLLVKTSEIARQRDWQMSIAKYQSKTTREERALFRDNQIEVINNSTFHHMHDVYGGTVFAFSHPRFAGLLDLLVIDEASQVPLANLLAMARCARNLLLVGDQQQLPQPVVAEHPGQSGLSCLTYATAGDEVISETKGLFLDTSWRMPPDLCGIVSETFYKDRLRSHPENAVNIIQWDGPASGLFFQAIEHTNNNVYSAAEADAIEELTVQLLGSTCIRNVKGAKQSLRITWEDIAVMAPFNAQVNLLERTLGDKARVGTVDRFQGQEAPIAIYSITSSSLLSPRALEFALNANRVNVAISRAQCLCIVVGSPVISQLLQSVDHLGNEYDLFTKLSAKHPSHASNT